MEWEQLNKPNQKWNCLNCPSRKFYEGPPKTLTCSDCGVQLYKTDFFFSSCGYPYEWVQSENYWTFVHKNGPTETKQAVTMKPIQTTEVDPESLTAKLVNIYFE